MPNHKDYWIFLNAPVTKTLFTIGYEGLDPERLRAVLKDARVGTLADVRAITSSRKRGFSKNILRSELEQVGIGYIHLRALGTPKAGRDAARADDAALMRRIYCEEVLETADGALALDELEKLASSSPACLLCFERDPHRCHRKVLTERLAARGFDVVDLFG